MESSLSDIRFSLWSHPQVSPRLLTVDRPPDTHLAQIEVALRLPRQFILLVAAYPALGAHVQLKVRLAALAPSIEKINAIALPTGLLPLELAHLLGSFIIILLLQFKRVLVDR